MIKTIKEKIADSFYRLLRGIVRLGLRNGLTHAELSAIMKQLYVSVSMEEYGLQGRPTNLARVALMTGLTRKEIKKISEAIEERQETPIAPSRLAKILTDWYENPLYQNSANEPLDIPINGPVPSFEHLTKVHGGNIAAITILREFKRSKTVSENNSTGKLQVHKRYYVPNYLGNSNELPELVNPEAIAQGGSMLIDHINTVFHNLYIKDIDNRGRFDLRATNTIVRKDSVNEFHTLINRKGMELLEEVDLWLSHHEVTEPSEEGERLGVGLYLIAGENDHSANKNNHN
jgi:hypothetical protein